MIRIGCSLLGQHADNTLMQV